MDFHHIYGQNQSLLMIQLHHKLVINHKCHIFIHILNDIVSCALTYVYPAREVLNWHVPTGKLINGPITLCLKVGCKGGQVISMAVWMTIAVLKPGRNGQAFHQSWPRKWVLVRTGRLWGQWYQLRVHRPWLQRKKHMGWWIEWIWHGHGWHQHWLLWWWWPGLWAHSRGEVDLWWLLVHIKLLRISKLCTRVTLVFSKSGQNMKANSLQ